MKKVELEIPKDMRLGQAILNALFKSGDLQQQSLIKAEPRLRPEKQFDASYKVTGLDLWEMDTDYIQALINQMVVGVDSDR